MSAITNTSAPTKETFIRKYPLFSFFVLAVGLTWIFMITDALGSHGLLPFRLPLPLMIVMGYMPTLAAAIVAGLTLWLLPADEGTSLPRSYLVVVLGYWLVISLVTAARLWRAGRNHPSVARRSMRMMSAGIAVLTVAILVAVVAPIAEEFFFRAFFYRALRTRLRVWSAALIDGLVFAALHFEGPHSAEILPVIAFFGVGQCLVYERTGSLFAVIAIGVAWWLWNRPAGSELGPVRGLTQRNPAARAGYTFLENKYYLDDLYLKGIVRPIQYPIARAAYASNQRIIDGIVNGSAIGTLWLSRPTYDILDQRVIDFAVNGAAGLTGYSGGLLRYIQSGNVQRYAAVLIAGIVIFVALFALT